MAAIKIDVNDWLKNPVPTHPYILAKLNPSIIGLFAAVSDKNTYYNVSATQLGYTRLLIQFRPPIAGVMDFVINCGVNNDYAFFLLNNTAVLDTPNIVINQIFITDFVPLAPVFTVVKQDENLNPVNGGGNDTGGTTIFPNGLEVIFTPGVFTGTLDLYIFLF